MKRKSTPSSLPDTLNSNLEALRSHYQGILDAYEEQVNSAREQMIHIEALLAQSPSQAKGQAKTASVPTSPAAKAEPTLPATAKATTASAKTKSSAKPPATAKGKSKRKSSLEFLAPYQDKTMLEAIAQVLQERKGKVVTIDQAVQALYGDLKPDLFKVAKERVMKSLSKGKQEGLWENVPNQLGCYTLSVKALKG